MPKVVDLLFGLGFKLERHQPHITGHRTILAPNKFLLVGRGTKNNLRVIIKLSNNSKGKKEILKEKKIRDALFSLHLLKLPKTIYFGKLGIYTIIITEFIPQERIFVSHPLPKQLSWIIQALKDREQLYSTVSDWRQKERKVFTTFRTENYLRNFERFRVSTSRHYPTLGLKETMASALRTLKDNASTMEKYENYLIHSDFVPHNFRIKNNVLFMLDCSAIQFGNKYEELARFLNYSFLHNPALDEKMKTYILKKRGKDEYLDLVLMRIYKVGQLIQFYARLLPKTSGNLLSLTIYRLDFWEDALRCIMQDQALNKKIRNLFLINDVFLTSKEEINRRKNYESF